MEELTASGLLPSQATRKTFASALETVKSRYDKYLASFGVEENWLKKKVEMELGTPILHLKQRVSGLGPEWSKVKPFVKHFGMFLKRLRARI